jgi:hypothetical protein
MDPIDYTDLKLALGFPAGFVVPAGAQITKVEVSLRIKSGSSVAFPSDYFVVEADNFVPNPFPLQNFSTIDGTCQVLTLTRDSTQSVPQYPSLAGFTNPSLALVRDITFPGGRFNWYGTRVEVTYTYQTYMISSKALFQGAPPSRAVQ